MIRISFMSRARLLILMIAAFQLISSSCSRRLYTEASFPNIESKAEKKKLKEFMTAGTEMKINTSNASPDKIIKTAEKYLGVPHCMGGTTSKCMDCSGLLVTVFAAHGIRLPHNSEEQARYGKIMNRAENLKRGDLVFFVRSYKTNRFITHSGIYLGNSRFIHASTTKGVTITSLSDPWWSGRFIFGTRLFD
ncbi:MAG: C40 family peptidase [Bacteroidales bacterium]|nr:C40 family peptidase [Bacteroidales bacterium]